MSPFEVLGLDADADVAAIKRAYAARLKQVRPDADAEAFQALHEAYRVCLMAAASRREAHDDPPTAVVRDREVDVLTPLFPAMASDDAQPGHGTRTTDSFAFAPEAFDPEAFADDLFSVSSTGSHRDIHAWLQSHDAFYAVGAREALAPAVIRELLERPNLPPRHLAALLNFFHLDEVGPEWSQWQEEVRELQARALMTPEHAATARELFGGPEPVAPRHHNERSIPPGLITVVIFVLIALARCAQSGGA